jgi:PadR family transcriptional regulator
MNPESLKGHLDLLLLAALAGRPMHGYAVLERLRGLSGGTFDLPEGTIYPALHRLEDAALLASRWDDASGRRRRIYRLTARGRRALERRREEWRGFAGSVEAVLDGGAA